ncbi:pitrilysin family protein [soil metagenome]
MRRWLGILVACLALGSCAYKQNPAPDSDRPTFQIPATIPRKADDVTIQIFPNGLTLIHRENKNNAIVGVVAYIKGGAALEDPQKNGATNLMMRMLLKGTKTRTADQIAEETAQLGASLSPAAGQDYNKLSMQCINEDLDAAMELFADVLQNPGFPVAQVDLERKKVLAQIRMNDDQVSTVAVKRFQKELFGAHPYGRPLEGTPETLPGIIPQDLLDRHDSEFVPSNMVIAVVGNVDLERAKALLMKNIGQVSEVRKPRYEVDKVIAPEASRVEVTKKSEQGFVVMGNLTCPAGDPDEAPVEVMSKLLGGGMSSRLFTQLRDKQGLAYAVGASASNLKNQGYIVTYIGTGPKTIDASEEGLWKEMRRLRDEPVEDAELQRAKNYIAGEYLRGHERNMQQASYLGYWHVTGRGVEYDKMYLDDINAVTTRDVMRVANKYFLDPTVVVLRPLPKL